MNNYYYFIIINIFVIIFIEIQLRNIKKKYWEKLSKYIISIFFYSKNFLI